MTSLFKHAINCIYNKMLMQREILHALQKLLKNDLTLSFLQATLLCKNSSSNEKVLSLYQMISYFMIDKTSSLSIKQVFKFNNIITKYFT